MSEKRKTATASDPTVGSTLAKQAIELKEAKILIDSQTEEIQKLKRQLTESTAVIDNELRAGFYQMLLGSTDFTKAELDEMATEDLQKLCQTLSRTKRDAKTPFLSIRAGGDADHPGNRLTVGSLYGIKRDEILKKAREV